MTTTTENQTVKPKQIPDFYIFENGPTGEKAGKLLVRVADPS